jgi:hypothetical protein
VYRKPKLLSNSRSCKKYQKFELQFYPELLLENGAFLLEYTIEHQMHFNQAFNVSSLFAYLLSHPIHCTALWQQKWLWHRAHFSSYRLGQSTFPVDSVLDEKLFLYLEDISKSDQ